MKCNVVYFFIDFYSHKHSVVMCGIVYQMKCSVFLAMVIVIGVTGYSVAIIIAWLQLYLQ